MNVMCLYWVGDFRGRAFTTEHVARLRQSVDKHIDRPYTFYCLTNDMEADIPAEKIELEYAWPGWWSKMELHRPDLPEGRTLYLDLDSHVIHDLSPILDYPGDLVLFKTRVDKYRKRKYNGTGGWVYRYQAATMLFTPGKFAWMYEKFSRHPKLYMAKYRSDQDVMGNWIPNQPTFPDGWMIKLNTCLSMKEPPVEPIIITGQPKGGEFHIPNAIPWLEQMARGKEASCT